MLPQRARTIGRRLVRQHVTSNLARRAGSLTHQAGLLSCWERRTLATLRIHHRQAGLEVGAAGQPSPVEASRPLRPAPHASSGGGKDLALEDQLQLPAMLDPSWTFPHTLDLLHTQHTFTHTHLQTPTLTNTHAPPVLLTHACTYTQTPPQLVHSHMQHCSHGPPLDFSPLRWTPEAALAATHLQHSYTCSCT